MVVEAHDRLERRVRADGAAERGVGPVSGRTVLTQVVLVPGDEPRLVGLASTATKLDFLVCEMGVDRNKFSFYEVTRIHIGKKMVA